MRKAVVVFSSLFLCFSLFKVGVVSAEDAVVAQTEVAANVEGQESSNSGLKQQFSEARSQIQEQKQGNIQNAQAARAEEDQLRQQIKAAMDSGDTLRVESSLLKKESLDELVDKD